MSEVGYRRTSASSALEVGLASLGVGILGAGWVAGEYVKAFRDLPQTEVVGLYSRSPGRASALLQALGVDGCEYSREDELFEDADVEIVVSCTPPNVRPMHVVRAAETGRHVVIEKPVGLSMAEVEKIRQAVVLAGVKTVTSFVLRWNPMIETIRKLVDDGIIGELLYAEADYWNPGNPARPQPWWVTKAGVGSAFLEGGCHAADAIRYLAGEVTEVSAFPCPAKRNELYEYDPIVVASLTFENGAVGKTSTVLDAETPYTFNIRLFGTDGTIQNNRVFSPRHYPGALDYWEFPTILPDSSDVTHHPFSREISHFVECITTDVESHASIHDTYKSMALVFAIDESAGSGGRPVSVADVVNGATEAARARPGGA
jgi:UDP-N-acetyl-2-amino-2-deoxyglucuronate dehydrogenase